MVCVAEAGAGGGALLAVSPRRHAGGHLAEARSVRVAGAGHRPAGVVCSPPPRHVQYPGACVRSRPWRLWHGARILSGLVAKVKMAKMTDI